MKNKLFIGSLSYTVTDAQLGEYFAKVGKVLSARVVVDRNTGQGKGFGFVEMETEAEAQKAMKELDNTSLDDRVMVVKEAKPRE